MSYVSKNPRFNSQILTDQGTNSVDDPASGSHKVVNRNGLLYMRDSSGNETAIGSAGATGGINYIDNPSAETGTDGWATYADAAGTTPVDGTGGSANVTLTRTTTAGEILRGDASFELTVDAANRQGEGFSYDFTIDKADQNKVLGIWFDVDATDANYADDDLQVFIYDKDQSQLITPTSPTNGYKIKGNQYRQRVAFAPYDTSSNDYRLIIHVASTNASGYSVRFDNFEVGPGKLETGSIVTDWQSYTPTTQGFGTITSVNLQWRRVGTNIEIKGDWTNGTTAAQEAQIGLPNSYTIDFKSATSAVPVGYWGRDAVSSQSGPVLATHGDSYFNFGELDTASADNLLDPSLATEIVGSSQRVALFASVPVAEFADSGIVITPSTEDLALSGWESFSQTGSWNTNTTYTAFKRRVGSDLEIDGVVELSGAPNSAFLTLNLPSGLTIDTAKIGNPVSNEHQLGSVLVHDDGGANLYGSIRYSSTTSVAVSYLLTVSSVQEFRGVSQAAPVTFANNDKITYRFKVPIAEWADLGQVPPIGVELASDTQYGLVKAGSIPGVTDGSTADAGNVGEFTTATNTGASITKNAGPQELESITLSAGSWLVWGSIAVGSSSDNNNSGSISVSQTADANGSTFGYDYTRFAIYKDGGGINSQGGGHVGPVLFDLSASDTIYLNGDIFASDSGSFSVGVSLKALRIR